MIKTVTLLSFSEKRVMFRTVLFLFVTLFSCAVAFSQDTDAKKEIGDLSSIIWKSTVQVDATIALENSRMDVALSQPNIQGHDRALYRSYQQMLGHIQLAIQGGKPVDESIYIGYEKVLSEAPLDIDLKELPTGVLITYIPGLIEALSEVPTPDVSGQ